MRCAAEDLELIAARRGDVASRLRQAINDAVGKSLGQASRRTQLLREKKEIERRIAALSVTR